MFFDFEKKTEALIGGGGTGRLTTKSQSLRDPITSVRVRTKSLEANNVFFSFMQQSAQTIYKVSTFTNSKIAQKA